MRRVLVQINQQNSQKVPKKIKQASLFEDLVQVTFVRSECVFETLKLKVFNCVLVGPLFLCDKGSGFLTDV